MNTFKLLQERMKNFVELRNWTEEHNPKNLSMSIAIEAAELMELYQWKNERDSLELSLHNEGFRAKLNDEIADVLIYCLSLANVANLDLMSAVEAKMDRNDQRFPASYRLI